MMAVFEKLNLVSINTAFHLWEKILFFRICLIGWGRHILVHADYLLNVVSGKLVTQYYYTITALQTCLSAAVSLLFSIVAKACVFTTRLLLITIFAVAIFTVGHGIFQGRIQAFSFEEIISLSYFEGLSDSVHFTIAERGIALSEGAVQLWNDVIITASGHSKLLSHYLQDKRKETKLPALQREMEQTYSLTVRNTGLFLRFFYLNLRTSVTVKFAKFCRVLQEMRIPDWKFWTISSIHEAE